MARKSVGEKNAQGQLSLSILGFHRDMMVQHVGLSEKGPAPSVGIKVSFSSTILIFR